jgi:hypothetical protein
VFLIRMVIFASARSGGAMSTAAGGLSGGAANTDHVGRREQPLGRRDRRAVGGGLIEYRAFYVKNNHATITWQSVVFWIDVATDVERTPSSMWRSRRRP